MERDKTICDPASQEEGLGSVAVEEWRDVPSSPSFSASSLGRIRSGRGAILTAHLRDDGYPQVSLPINGRRRGVKVHVLVAEAFLGPRPSGHDVDHVDHNRQNARADNLRYLPVGDNRSQVGAANGRAALSEEQAREIIALPRTGKRGGPNGLAAIAARYGVGKITIADLLAGRTWPHLARPNQNNQEPPQ